MKFDVLEKSSKYSVWNLKCILVAPIACQTTFILYNIETKILRPF